MISVAYTYNMGDFNTKMPNKSDMESNIRIGKMLQTARESRKISQAALAKQIGMSTNHISAIERGVSKASIDTLLGYCRVLNMTPDQILGYSDDGIVPELKNRLLHTGVAEQKKILDILHIVEA